MMHHSFSRHVKEAQVCVPAESRVITSTYLLVYSGLGVWKPDQVEEAPLETSYDGVKS